MVSSSPTSNAKHPFEIAGLGVAPFTAIGMAERTFQACPGEPVRAGGCCNYCAAGIRYAVIVKSADGKVFDVGRDCADKIDPEIHREARAIQKREHAARIAEYERGKREAYLAELRIQQAANLAEARAELPEIAAMVDALEFHPEFPGKLAARIVATAQADGTFLDYDAKDPQEQVRKLIGCYTEEIATGHVGEHGKKINLRVRYLSHVSFETMYGIKTIYKFAHERADGTVGIIVWGSTSYVKVQDNDAYSAGPGSMLEISGTVEHGEYRGRTQTTIKRPKFRLAI
jgi:hypothetical protein